MRCGCLLYAAVLFYVLWTRINKSEIIWEEQHGGWCDNMSGGEPRSFRLHGAVYAFISLGTFCTALSHNNTVVDLKEADWSAESECTNEMTQEPNLRFSHFQIVYYNDVLASHCRALLSIHFEFSVFANTQLKACIIKFNTVAKALGLGTPSSIHTVYQNKHIEII